MTGYSGRAACHAIPHLCLACIYLLF